MASFEHLEVEPDKRRLDGSLILKGAEVIQQSTIQVGTAAVNSAVDSAEIVLKHLGGVDPTIWPDRQLYYLATPPDALPPEATAYDEFQQAA